MLSSLCSLRHIYCLNSNGYFEYSFVYIGTDTLTESLVLSYLPIIFHNDYLIGSTTVNINGNIVTVNIQTILRHIGSELLNCGITFNSTSLQNFYNTQTTTLTILSGFNCPLSKNGSQFSNLTSLNILPSFVPYFLTDTSLDNCFYNNTNFNSDISYWNTTNVTNMSSMFNGCISFKQDIGSWNVSNVITMENMFLNVDINYPSSATNQYNYNSLLISWSTLPNIQSNVNFNAGMSKYSNITSVKTAYDILTNNKSWVITTSNSNESIDSIVGTCTYSFYYTGTSNTIANDVLTNYIPINNNSRYFGYTAKVSVSNTSTTFVTVVITTFLTPDWLSVNLSRHTYGISFGVSYAINNFYTSNYVTQLTIDGTNCILSRSGSQFYNMSNITINKNFKPLFVRGATLFKCFSGCNNFDSDIGGWDTSNVTNMSYMFANCNTFNQNISGWDTSKVLEMDYMFVNCTTFNQNISSWNTSPVKTMSNMFYGCSAFNQPINAWNTSSVQDMRYMFYGCSAFNQPINAWNVSLVINMMFMFYNCEAFKQDIGDWNVSLVENMQNMFFSSNINITDTTNYDSLLNKWAILPNLRTNVTFHGGASKYSSSAQTSRNILTETNSWYITDGGPI